MPGPPFARRVYRTHLFNKQFLVLLTSRQQCFNWNTQPFRGRFQLSKNRHLQQRMICYECVQFGVMLSVRARDIECGLHLSSSIRQSAIECDVKDVIEIEVDRIESGQICESIK